MLHDLFRLHQEYCGRVTDVTEIMHADIFFFITAIAVVVVGLGWVIALYYIILILREVYEIAKIVRSVSATVENDFGALREKIHGESARVRSFFEFLIGLISHKARSRTKKKDAHEMSE